MLLTSKYLRDILILAVASPIEALTMLYWPVHIGAWLRCFAALARLKKLKNEKASRIEYEIRDIFLATVFSDAVNEISKMAPQKRLKK